MRHHRVWTQQREPELQETSVMFAAQINGLLQENEKYVMHHSLGTMVSREGNRDTLKLACWYRVTTHTLSDLAVVGRELESVRRELRNLKTGQHENTDGTRGEAMTANEMLTHAKAGHAALDSRSET